MTDTEYTALTRVTKPQRPDGVYPETQTHTPHSETEGAHTHPLDSITAVPPTLSHTWTNYLPRDVEKDESMDREHLQTAAVTFDPTPPHTRSNPDDNTTGYSDQNTLWTESKETVSKDESKEMREGDEDRENLDRSLTEDKDEEVKMSQGNHIPLVSTPSGAATNQILFHSVTLSLPVDQNTEAPPTPTQLPPEENRDESREDMSSEDEQITEMLQVTTPSKVIEDRLLEKHKLTTKHTHTITQDLSEDTESHDEEERSNEDNMQMNVEIQDSIAAQITTTNALTPMPSHLLPTQHTEVKALITPSQVTSTSSLQTTNTPVTQRTSHRPTTHTLLTRLFTPRTIQTHTTFTVSSDTSHAPLTKPSVTHKTSVTLPQSPGIIWRIPVTNTHSTAPHLRHTPKPNTSQASADPTTQGYSEEEEENTEIKKELMDSSQEAESKSKSQTKIHRRCKHVMPHVALHLSLTNRHVSLCLMK